MDDQKKQEILQSFKDWFRNELAPAHKVNTEKLVDAKEFAINPFLWSYLAYYFNGKADAETLAKVLFYPRALGTSINTIFGTRFQQFITKYFLETSGSQIEGIDIEFIDKTDGRKKYCQIKADPNVVNFDDVTTVKNHFLSALRRARTNNEHVENTDYMFCLLYGEPWQQNQFVNAINRDYPVVIGKEFWNRFTGDPSFYTDLIDAVGEVANEFDMKETVEAVISQLSTNIGQNFPSVVEKK